MQLKVIIGVGLLVLVLLVVFLPNAGSSPVSKQKTEGYVSETIQQKEEQPMAKKQFEEIPKQTLQSGKTYTATLETDKGELRVTLFADEVPVTVNNFVFLAREKFYDNTVFHRIIKGFMVQGGDPEGTGRGGPGYRFADEKITREYTRGTLAMANAGPNTNGSQFFIMHVDYKLPKNYVIFGEIDPKDTPSLITLDAIAQSPVTDNGMGEVSKPVAPVTLKRVTIEEK